MALAQEPPEQAPPETAPAAPTRPPPAEAPAGTAPTDEEIAARALERALVQRGALLLPPWRGEVVPQLAYGHDSFDTAAALEGGGFTVGRVRAHVATSSLGFRLGLPGKLQVEGVLPFLAATRRLNVGTSTQHADVGPGIGDVRVSLTRHVLSTRGGAFQVLAGGSWRAPSGKSPFSLAQDELARGQGVHSLSATATLVRIADPLVLLAGGTYTTYLSRTTPLGRVDLADTVRISLSSLLAVTPSDSLSLGFELEHAEDFRLGGTTAIGTDRTSAVAQLGVSTIVSRRVLIAVSAAMGITSDAPDFQLALSVPVTF